jgi:CubicO group peptidase (beta-lactamase class C family)
LLLASTERALSHRSAVAQARNRLPSLVGGVVREGEAVWTHAIEGSVDHQYRIGSLTKAFVAVLVMRLRDEGQVDLSDPVTDHLGDVAPGPLTIRQLLSHTAGLVAEAPGPWWERTPGDLRPTLADVMGGQPQRHPAGQRFHYSNPGYALLGALVEQKRGRPWAEALAEEVLDPLGMTRTSVTAREPFAAGWAVHPWADVLLPEAVHHTGRMAPAGQLWSTVADLGRFAAFLVDGADGVLSSSTVAEMRTPHAPPATGASNGGYGLGLQILRSGERVLAGHTGSMPGYLCALWVGVEERIGAVAMTNATSGLPIGSFVADLVSVVGDHEPSSPRPWRPLSEVDPAVLALTGVWYWGPAGYALRLRGDAQLELVALQGGGAPVRFRRTGSDEWIGCDGYWDGETLRPRPDHLNVGEFVFTREPYDAEADIPGGVDAGGWRPMPNPDSRGGRPQREG